MENKMIEFNDVSLHLNGKNILESIDLTIEDGEFMVLVGSSGSGKTSLLKMVNRLNQPSSGNIEINGTEIQQIDIKKWRLEVGYILQQIALFPNLTVEENVKLIPNMKKWKKTNLDKMVKELLIKAGLDPKIYSKRYPRELSGGEQQRVGILRAIIGNPKVLLMDEPFSALDQLSKKQLQHLIKSLHREFSMTTLFITHDTNEAIKLADRIAVLHEGNLIQVATPEEIIIHPKNEFVKELFRGALHE